ncbi:MAG: hypothetical protein WC383_17710, partial [Gammaproteobacteria bacterium]
IETAASAVLNDFIFIWYPQVCDDLLASTKPRPAYRNRRVQAWKSITSFVEVIHTLLSATNRFTERSCLVSVSHHIHCRDLFAISACETPFMAYHQSTGRPRTDRHRQTARKT